MLSIPIDPALILSSPLRPLNGQPALDVLLVQGEAVQATVLDVQSDGSLLILIKGIALPASSLVGRLPVGTVLQAHVEAHEGQILLRLDQPVQPARIPGSPGPAPVPGFVDSSTGDLRIAALLKTLLPADEPLAAGLARLAESVREAAVQGEITPEAAADFEAIHQQVLLEGRPGGQPLSGERIQAALKRLGLEHEHRILTAWHETGTAADPAVKPTLKSWLMTMLAEAPPDLVPDASSAAAPASFPQSPPPRPLEQPASSPARPASATATLLAEPMSSGASTVPTSETAEILTDRLRLWIRQAAGDSEMRNEEPMFRREASGRPETVLQEEPVAKAAGLVPSNDQAGKEKVQMLRMDAQQPEERPAGGTAEGGAQATQQGKTAGSSAGASQPVKVAGGFPLVPGRLAGSIAPMVSAGPADSTDLLRQPRTAGEAGLKETGWLKDAQQVLTIIERTQVLTSLNSQSGQPILLDIPLAWGGEARARLYMEHRDGGEQGSPGQPRPYSVVTLLELDGIGGVRVDTVITGRRISTRFLLDRPDVERAVASVLPALSHSLSAKGYQVDLITSGTAEPRQVRGEDLRARSTPRFSLVNVRA